MSEASEQRREASLTRRKIRDLSALIVTNLRLADRNGDGRLSPEEGASFVRVTRVATTTPETDTSSGQPSTNSFQTLPYHSATPSQMWRMIVKSSTAHC